MCSAKTIHGLSRTKGLEIRQLEGLGRIRIEMLTGKADVEATKVAELCPILHDQGFAGRYDDRQCGCDVYMPCLALGNQHQPNTFDG